MSDVQLRPGYWRSADGAAAFVVGPNPHATSPEYGWIGAWVDGGVVATWSISGKHCDELEDDLIEYLGPTLPPEPGEGYRLLKDDDVIAHGDEHDAFGRWCTIIPSFHVQTVRQFLYAINQPHSHVRRRIEPEPQWERTMELRLTPVPETYKGTPVLTAKCDNGYGSYSLSLQQRWTCGDQSKWRDVPVSS